ncbi:MAG: lipid-A-disaccharide synthase [Bacteroidetes bacterium]|nr:MAG: lipid-A-disaccharide synthase [Bacteroidota bacterium]
MSPKKKIYLIAGEASGDLHGSNLIKALLEEDASLEFRFWGGDLMSKYAGPPVKHIKELAFMGFIEVLKNIRTILSNIRFCKEDILKYKPDALVLIDYPGFNLRIAEWAKKEGIKVYYYISPQVWAWKQSRVHKIKRSVDHLFTILPFESDFYKRFDFDVEYVGHPLLDAVDQFRQKDSDEASFRKTHELSEKPLVAILPGSRKQEIRTKLPVMLQAIDGLDQFEFVIAGAPALDASFYEEFLKQSKHRIIHDATYDLLNFSESALVTSGTATLETALFNVPEVVCYKASPISYQIARKLVKIKYISLVNLIMDREVVKELIQGDCNPSLLRSEFLHIVPGGSKRSQMLEDFEKLRKILGTGGASKKVAQSLLKTI